MARFLALMIIALSIVACGTTGPTVDGELPFQEPSSFLREEITQRIAALPLQSDEQLVRNMKRLVYIGEPSIPLLIEGLSSEHPRTRGSCAWILGVLRDRRTIDALRGVLRDEVPVVRYEAATSICIMGDPEGYGVLIDGLSDPDIRNRYKAHEALRLLTRLDFGYKHDDAPSKRVSAVTQWEEWFEKMEATRL